MFNKIFLIVALIGVPLSVLGKTLHWPQTIMFAVYCITIIALAALWGERQKVWQLYLVLE